MNQKLFAQRQQIGEMKRPWGGDDAELLNHPAPGFSLFLGFSSYMIHILFKPVRNGFL